MRKVTYLLALLLLSAFGLKAEVKLPSILGSNMVLQQQTQANLWGTATPNTQVTIKTSWNNKVYTTPTDASGGWIQAVQTPGAGGPYTISISDGTELTLHNVLIGEVWVCSGQSNMQQTMAGYYGQPTFDAADLINQARTERRIRIASVKLEYSRTPKDDCTVRWQENTSGAVKEASAVAYFFADYIEKALNVPVGIICTSWGGSNIETWIDKATFSSKFPDISLEVLTTTGEVKNPNQKPTLLYNAMIHPIEKYAVKGALWYQGESNRGKPALYEKLQAAMMELWRQKFNNPEMPFYYAQIAPYGYDKKNNSFVSGFFYEAQANIMKNNRNCGMAVTVDTGEEDCIHPARKREVGERLAFWALAETYGNTNVEYKSPMYKSMEVKEGKALISVEYASNGLWSPDYRNLKGFEVAGADKKFVPAQARLEGGGRTISVWSPGVKTPVAVRYCFRDFQMGSIFSNFGLPLAPFRTDNWEK